MAKQLIPSRYTIRTSDRRVFRRCLRKWNLSSSLKGNWTKKGAETNIHFWFGSAIHFAFEDYHGWNRFGDPRQAFTEYYKAFAEKDKPEGAAMMYSIGIGMLTYYLDWYPRHNNDLQIETIWFDKEMNAVPPFTPGAEPAVEQRFWLPIDLAAVVDVKTGSIICEYSAMLEEMGTTPHQFPRISREKAAPFDILALSGQKESETVYYVDSSGEPREVKIVPIHYHGTTDKLVVDKHGRWWILDYKTAKGADTNKLDTDDQISAYLWAASRMYKHEIYGFIYLQLTKDVAKPPKMLKDGTMSTDKKQKTTRMLVKQELIKQYGSITRAPNKYIEFLNTLADQEFPEGDRFIRWDFVRRSSMQIQSTYNHILGEAHQMLQTNLYMYPNPTRDCIWDCPWRDACLAMDDGRIDDVMNELNMYYEQRGRSEDGDQGDKWRKNFKFPGDPIEVTDEFGNVTMDIYEPEPWSEFSDLVAVTPEEEAAIDNLFHFTLYEEDN